MTVRKMLPDDIGECVSIHLACFPQSFLSFLGKEFLRTYYDGVARSELMIAMVHEEDRQIVGFVVGFTDPRKCYEFLLRTRTLQFCKASIKAILERPIIIPRLLAALTYPNKIPSGADQILLSSIAVLSSCRRRGVGKSLVHAFLTEGALRGGLGVYLGVKIFDKQTISFYRGLGFAEATNLVNPGSGDSILMVRSLRD